MKRNTNGNEKFVCEACGLHPYKYADNGIGMQAIAVNCCEIGFLVFSEGMTYEQAYGVMEDLQKEIDSQAIADAERFLWEYQNSEGGE